jgi:P4 family phage/plasmid primase-like protien
VQSLFSLAMDAETAAEWSRRCDMSTPLAENLGVPKAKVNGAVHLNGNGVASVWGDHAVYLAEWAQRRLVNRVDRWGAIGNMAGKPGWYKATGRLTTKKLACHFEGADPTDVIGVYSTAPDHDGACWSLWLGEDFDHHGEGPAPEAIWKAALACYVVLTGLGFRPILEDSNGRGGYHVWVLFNERVQTAVVRAFGLWLVRDWKALGLDDIPEVFPKQDQITAKDCGNLLRLPGRHFKHPDHFSRIWGGDRWLEGEDAVDYLVSTIGDDPALIPPEVRAFAPKREKPRSQIKASTPNALEQLKQDLISIDRKLGESSVDWQIKQLSEGHDILIGQCPFEHESGSSNHGDLSAGFHDDGPYFKCLHDSCERAKEVHGQLTRLHNGGSSTGVNEAVDDPHAVARLYLRKHCTHEAGLTIRFYKDEFARWERAAYRPVPTKEINAGLNQIAKVKFDAANRFAIEQWAKRGGKDEDGKLCQMPQAKKVSTRLIGDVNQALTGLTLLKSSVEPPAWLTDNPPLDAREMIPCRNALVHLPSLAAGQSAVIKPTPTFFSTYALDYDFDADAPFPAEWLRFLQSLWPNDSESIDTLGEFFGYCLTADTRQQKLLSLIGPKRAGKDTIVRILRAMIGPDNVAGPTLSSLATNFGLWPLIGKPVAIISDARLSGRSDIAVIVERILTITGESTLTIDRKNREPWTGKLGTRLVIVSNEMPKLSDASGALIGRFILLKLTESFYGREDKELFDRLVKELPGILLWAIQGWWRLNARGHFLQPETGRQMVSQMEDIASPVGAFMREKCELDSEGEIWTKELFDAWRTWCESSGKSKRDIGDAQNLGRHLAAIAPQVRVKETRRKDESGQEIRMRVYVGIRLRVVF